MKRAHHFTVVVLGCVLIAAAVLSPGRQERAAMLASEGRHEEAIALLQRQLARFPHNPDLLAALARSYAGLGDVDRAIDAFDTYLRLRPADLEARKRQAGLLLQSGLLDRFFAAQAYLVAAQPSAGQIARLLELYRLHGRVKDETAMLQAYAQKDMLDLAQFERLGALLAQQGNWAAARHWLEVADKKAPAEARVGRLLLLEVLIHGDDRDEISRRAQAWMTAWRSPYLAGRLILRLSQAGLPDLAYKVALDYTEMTPDAAFDIVGLMAGKGYPGLARDILVAWAERSTRPTGEQLRTFVQNSTWLGDFRGPFTKLLSMLGNGPDAAAQARAAEELAGSFGMLAVEAVRPLLSDEALLARPLFAAELALFEGNREMARWFLNRIDPGQLSAEQLASWLSLLYRVQPEAEAFSRLAMLWNEGRLPPELLPHLAEEAGKLGQVGVRDAIWGGIRQAAASELAN